MYLTFKDKHDSNVVQRDVWYKKEKCCFDFLYHNRLSLSSTLCGEEPKIIIIVIPWLLSLTALHQFLYYKYPRYYFFFVKRWSKWRDTKWRLSLQFQLNREVDFFREFEQVLSDLYPNKRRLFNLKNKKQYEFGEFVLTVQYDLDVSQGETVSVDLLFNTITVTLNTAKDKLKELRKLFNKLGQRIPMQDPNFNLKIYFIKVKNPFYGLMIQRLGEEHVKYFECQFPISIFSKKAFNKRDEQDLELVVYKDYVSINVTIHPSASV